MPKKRRPGRPPTEEHREVRLVLLLTTREFDALDTEARANALQPNACARAIVVRRLRAAGLLR